MVPTRLPPPSSAAYICRSCRRAIAHRQPPLLRTSLQAWRDKGYHTQPALRATVVEAPASPTPAPPPPSLSEARRTLLPIRKRLQQWDREFGGLDEEALDVFERHPAHLTQDQEISNDLARLNARSQFYTKLDELDTEEDVQLETVHLFLRPGDVVDISFAGSEPTLAVFTQQLANVAQFFTKDGTWLHRQLSEISFVLKSAIDPAMIEPLLPYLPTKHDPHLLNAPVRVPNELSANALSSLNNLYRDAERIYRNHATILDSAHSALADATEMRMMTLGQITKALLQHRESEWNSPAAQLAVRRALSHATYAMNMTAPGVRLTNRYTIRPRVDVGLLSEFLGWVRDYLDVVAQHTREKRESLSRPKWNEQSKGAEYVAEFVEKAKILIDRSREDRPVHGKVLGASRSSTAIHMKFGQPFTESDKKIIEILMDWVYGLQSHASACPASAHSAFVTILAATKRYKVDERISRSEGALFLQEIGVVLPWEDSVAHDARLMLPMSKTSQNMERLQTRCELARTAPGFQDSMAGLRQDWGSMTVFCIDSATTKEIDDGVSISKVPDKDEYWLHVHIANPTAFFKKSHVLSALAAHMTESVYLIDRMFPMLPTWVSRDYFSLDRNRPVLTVSTLLDSAGNILESKIQPGIVRNIVNLTPSQALSLLGIKTSTITNRLVVGPEVPPIHQVPSLPHISPSQLKELRDLYHITMARRSKRSGSYPIENSFRSKDVKIFEQAGIPGLICPPPSIDRARHVYGDPTIIISATQKAPDDNIQSSDESDFVEEMMVLACGTAATWCAERQVPIIFRGSLTLPEVMTIHQFERDFMLPCMEKYGRLPLHVQFAYSKLGGRTSAHVAPLKHQQLGLGAYTKISSPLRRFADMIGHWQIEAALRHEAETGKKFTAADVKVLPFSLQQVQDSIATLIPRETDIKLAQKRCENLWTTLAIARALETEGSGFSRRRRVIVGNVVPNSNEELGRAWDAELHLRFYLKSCKDLGEKYKIGDIWEVDICDVDSHRGFVGAVPVRLIEREEFVVDPYTLQAVQS